MAVLLTSPKPSLKRSKLNKNPSRWSTNFSFKINKGSKDSAKFQIETLRNKQLTSPTMFTGFRPILVGLSLRLSRLNKELRRVRRFSLVSQVIFFVGAIETPNSVSCLRSADLMQFSLCVALIIFALCGTNKF